MSNVHTLADLKDDDGPNSSSFPAPNQNWGGGGGATSGTDNEANAFANRRTGTQPDDTFWSHNLPPGEPYKPYHIFLNCCFPCFIGPLFSKVRQKDYLALLYQSLFWIIWINLIYLIVECAFGFVPLDIPFLPAGTFPNNPAALVNTGCKYTRSIKEGHIWRLITPIFMHGGIIHFLMNNLVIFYFGLGYERKWWFFRMIPIYFISGIFGNILSCLSYLLPLYADCWICDTLSVGASGAILGFMFAKISNIICRWHLLLPYERIMHGTSIVTILIFSVLMSIGVQNVDFLAHFGGAMMGFLLGFIAFANYIKNIYLKITAIIAPLCIILLMFVVALVFLFVFPCTNCI